MIRFLSNSPNCDSHFFQKKMMLKFTVPQKKGVSQDLSQLAHQGSQYIKLHSTFWGEHLLGLLVIKITG